MKTVSAAIRDRLVGESLIGFEIKTARAPRSKVGTALPEIVRAPRAKVGTALPEAKPGA
jgi:hypothetical protein